MCHFLVVNECDAHLSFHCVKSNKGRLRCTEIIWKYELISAIKTSRNPENQFSQEHKITQNSPETALVWFFVISLTYSGHWNKTCVHCSTQKPFFIFLTSFYVISVLWAFKKYCHFINFFSFCMMFGMHFDNVSVFLNSVVAVSIHLATSSVRITC